MSFRINGKDYQTVEEMPPEVRIIYEQRLGKRLSRTATSSRQTTPIFMNGKRYDGEHELPAELRVLYHRIQGALRRDGNGLLDYLAEGGILDSEIPANERSAQRAERDAVLRHTILLRTTIAALLATLSGLLALFWIVR